MFSIYEPILTLVLPLTTSIIKIHHRNSTSKSIIEIDNERDDHPEYVALVFDPVPLTPIS
jgi:hypothetical protein